jgi:hypothetical protein
MAVTLGFEEGGYEYHSIAGAERLRDALSDFEGGRVLVSVLGQRSSVRRRRSRGCFSCMSKFTQQGIRDAAQNDDDVPDAAPGPGDGGGLATVLGRVGLPRNRGASSAPRDQHRPGRPHGIAGHR